MDAAISKGDLIEGQCGCGEVVYSFMTSLDAYSYGCPTCGKLIYQLTCPHCQSGFSIPENEEKQLKKETHEWKCDVCGKWNPIPHDILEKKKRGYLDSELPTDVHQKLEKQSKISRLVFAFIIGVTVLLAILLS